MARVSLLLSALFAAALYTCVLGTPLPSEKKGSTAPRTLALPLFKKRTEISKRNEIFAPLANEIVEYNVKVGVGTPAQTIILQLDTGSSDTWVFSSSACPPSSCKAGSFEPKDSSTFVEKIPNAFNITYADGSGVTGDFFADNLEIAGVTVTALEMGLATAGRDISTGIMGISFVTQEAEYAEDPYPNIIVEMVSQGLIGAPIYSLWLDDLAADSGTVLFGGYDKSKYQGTLAVLPINPVDGVYIAMLVEWTSLSLTDSKGTYSVSPSGYKNITILDSGTALTYIPTSFFTPLAKYFGVEAAHTSNGDFSYFAIDCRWATAEGTVNYGFPGVAILVPFPELVVPNGDGTCAFGLFPSDDQTIFGDTFLRSAYVVYDLGNKEIGLAQTVFV